MALLASPLTATAIGYLLGSLPSAVWIGRFSGVDPRTAGDRNPGASNVWTLAGWRAGLVVAVLDCAKGAASALAGLALAGQLGSDVGMVAAMAGHAWPWWSGFRRGGRSVAVLIGAAPVLAPLAAGIALLVFAAILVILPFRVATGIAVVSYLPIVALVAPDGPRLLALGVAYLVMLVRGAGRHTRHPPPPAQLRTEENPEPESRNSGP